MVGVIVVVSVVVLIDDVVDLEKLTMAGRDMVEVDVMTFLVEIIALGLNFVSTLGTDKVEYINTGIVDCVMNRVVVKVGGVILGTHLVGVR